MASKSIDASPSEMILREDLLKLMPIVNGSNRMAAELKKGVDYELVLAPPGLKVGTSCFPIGDVASKLIKLLG